MIVHEPVAIDGWEARLQLNYHRARGRTVVACEHTGPLAVQKPFYPEGPEVCHSILLHPPGGVAAGDALTVALNLEDASHALLTTPGAGKWYKGGEGAHASQILEFRVAQDAILEWLPQESIIFNGARAKLQSRIELTAGARYLGWEILCLGRAASGERFERGELRVSCEIIQSGKRLWGEYANLSGVDSLLASPIGMAGCTVTGALVAAGKEVALEVVTSLRRIEPAGAERYGISALPKVLVARYLGNSSERARRYFSELWHLLRPWFAGRPACPPRIWNT
jgi:urease accessory protein